MSQRLQSKCKVRRWFNATKCHQNGVEGGNPQLIVQIGEGLFPLFFQPEIEP